MSDAHLTTEELRTSVREFLEAEGGLEAVRRATSAAGFGFEPLWAKVAELGWLGLGIEEHHGGLGLGLASVGVLCEELGRALTPLPLGPTLLAAVALRVAGSAAQQAARLPPIAAGARRASVALPGAEPLPALDRSGRVRGRVACIVDADRVDDLFLPVRDAGGSVCLAILAADLAGVRVEPRPAIDLTRTLADVVLEDAYVAPEALLALDTRRWGALIDRAAVLIASDAVGGATHILERTVTYLGSRVQFERPIGSFQALKHRAATWKILVESVSALTRHAATLVDAGGAEGAATASAAKFSACDAYIQVAGDAVQLHGGIGFTWDHECHLFLKRAHLDAVLHGRSRQHRERHAALAFGDRYQAHPEHCFLQAPPSPP
jgi:alkylation response protein AidB-like acyl-CoA dehydrogenase